MRKKTATNGNGKVKLSSLKKNPSNPRFIKDSKFELLKKSLQDFPEMMSLRPIVVDDTNTVLGGNMRLEALKALGYKEISNEWIKRADELTEAQKKEFAIKDNAGFGEWSWDDIANEWSNLPLVEWGLDLPDEWLSATDDFSLPDGDRAPFQQMTFTVSDEQAEIIKAALEKAKKVAAFIDTGNENSNGNALARIAEGYV